MYQTPHRLLAATGTVKLEAGEVLTVLREERTRVVMLWRVL
jgi:hypothetical protein